ncbi:outer membrane beta-barrel protein [Flavobacterium sp.]|uniref:outer membrane beta-barrel protein n=1 Tax=Flavobacterium sp. TaxID=239 RepID=UPI0026355FAA|nr:outer membrane beta-barrel protein [Flavobacterium sp.]
MKKLFLLAGFALMSLTANAQEGLKGAWWAAGQVSFSSDKAGDDKSTSNMILPIVGTFISPSVTVGAGVGVISGKTEVGSVTTSETSTFVVKPLVRKYWNIKGGLFFYGQAALPVTFGKDKVADSKTSSFSLELAPGFDYFVNKWLTVETSFTIFNVGTSTFTPDSGDKTTSFDFNANPMNSIGDRQLGSLQVGVKFLF